jgi:hydrogenase-4 component F
LLWVAIESTTLASVLLVRFYNQKSSLEAAWKYIIIGSAGIALALFGTVLVYFSAVQVLGEHAPNGFNWSVLMEVADKCQPAAMRLGFVMVLVGYGTKAGLAPMHTWKPDAYGEAPSIVGAILAGGVTTVAFTAILRVRAVVGAAGEGRIADRTLLVIGLFSMLVAALFLLGTRDFKRMLAYSSVEHMGILSIGAALGGAGVAAALFHVWSNGLTKGALFLSAGNIRRAAGSPSMDDVHGMSVLTPRSAAIFVTGMFAVTALPPFGPFFSELQVIRAALASRQGVATTMFLGCLLLAFLGMGRVVFGVVDGRPRPTTRSNAKRFVETAGVIAPPLVLLGLSLWLGLFTPAILRDAWTAAVTQLFPTP